MKHSLAILIFLSFLLCACEATPTPTLAPTSAPTTTLTPTATATVTSSPTATITSSATPTNTDTPAATVSPTPACLRLLAPPDGSQLGRTGKISFTWEAFPGAAGYQIEFTVPEGKPVSFKTTSTHHDRYIESLPWAGDFTWQVTALDGSGKALCTSDAWRFSKLLSPLPAETPGPRKEGAPGADDGPGGGNNIGNNQ